MEDKNISQYVLNALNELKQIAKEKYELYILFINSYEQNDKKSIYDISLKLLDCISKKDNVFATLDKDSFKELYDFIDESEEDVISQPSYISFLYEDIIEYYKSIYYDGEDLDEDDYEETLEYEDDDEDDLIAFLGNIIPQNDANTLTDDELDFNRLGFKIQYNYKLTTGSKDLLIHNFIIKTLKDLYEMILNVPNKERNIPYFKMLLKEYKKLVIKYMLCNPEFERDMLKNNLDITKITCKLPEIDSDLAMSFIEKNKSDGKFSNEAESEVVNAFNQKLFENLYPYLSDEIKATLENGSFYGR